MLLVAEGDELQIRAALPPDATSTPPLSAPPTGRSRKGARGWGTGTLPRIAFSFGLCRARGAIAVGFSPILRMSRSAEDERALTAIPDLTAIALTGRCSRAKR